MWNFNEKYIAALLTKYWKHKIFDDKRNIDLHLQKWVIKHVAILNTSRIVESDKEDIINILISKLME